MNRPHHDYRARKLATPVKRYTGLDRLADKLRGKIQRRKTLLSLWQQQAQVISDKALALSDLTDHELAQHLMHLKNLFRRKAGQVNETQLGEAYSLIVEAAERCLGMRPYQVQIVAAIALYKGYLAEMATGEGKTLTAAFPAILAAWSAKPCHLVTANDYLARRDSEALAPLYTFCSATTGWISGEMDTLERQRNYRSDIVYTTGKELLADFLRDRLIISEAYAAERLQLLRYLGKDEFAQGVVLRGIDTAIIDEADSVLIDEAITPLIISKPQPGSFSPDAYHHAYAIATQLSAVSDYQANRHYQEIQLTPSGRDKMTKLATAYLNNFGSKKNAEELISTALMGKEFFHNKKNYVVVDGQIVIVDEFTGRMMPGRSWRQGLHQAIEAQENLSISQPNETLTQLSFQNFFRLFNNLSGLTGTAHEAAHEFWAVYRLAVITIPTNKPCQRKKLPSKFFLNQYNKWQDICSEVERCHASGQPVLVGTRSIEDSEILATMLSERAIPYRLLNATKNEQEAEIIATAGKLKQVIIATNMAGRGADIKLGSGVAEKGGLYVIVSEPHRSKRIDRQLAGRCARQGQPGMTRLFASAEDLLLVENLPRFFLPLYRLLLKKSTPTLFIALAQIKAQKKAAQQREQMFNYDEWLNDALPFSVH
jgi:preprotein translocase subunit SecA